MFLYDVWMIVRFGVNLEGVWDDFGVIWG